jgi:mannose/fructose-specific phosphotransferase system component IIA
MIGGIVLTHGQIGSALIGATASILGQVDNIHAISTSELSLQDINAKLKQIIAMQNWTNGTIVMVSLRGGSCWNSALFLAQQLPKIEVVSGVNLTMLISFLSKRDRYSLSKLAEIIKEDGIRGIERFTIN